MSQDQDKMAELNGVRRIIDALREVSDLDTAQAITASNETADKMAPWLQRWLLDLIGQERIRRETGEEPKYSIVNPLEWPADELAATALFAIGTLQCSAATQPQIPTVTQFCATLAKVFTSNLSTRFLVADPTRSNARG